MVHQHDHGRRHTEHLDDRAAAGDDRGRLRPTDHHVVGMGGRLGVHHIPLGPDRVEVGGEVEALIDEVDAGPLPNLHLQRIVVSDGADRAVEGDVAGVLVGHVLTVERGHAVAAGLVDKPLALHDRPLVFGLGKRFGGIDDEHAVHTHGDVHRHILGSAVVHEGARVQQPGLDGSRLARRHQQVGGTAVHAGDCVEVDVVRMHVGLGVGERDAHHVSHPTSDDGAWCAGGLVLVTEDLEAPHLGHHVVRWVEVAHPLDHLEVHVEASRL